MALTFRICSAEWPRRSHLSVFPPAPRESPCPHRPRLLHNCPPSGSRRGWGLPSPERFSHALTGLLRRDVSIQTLCPFFKNWVVFLLLSFMSSHPFWIHIPYQTCDLQSQLPVPWVVSTFFEALKFYVWIKSRLSAFFLLLLCFAVTSKKPLHKPRKQVIFTY